MVGSGGRGRNSRATQGSKKLPKPVLAALSGVSSYIEKFDWSGLSDRRLEIVTTFLRVMAAQGYSAVTMRGLGAELNLKAPSIYSHFPGGKEEIIAISLRRQACLFGEAVLAETAFAVDVDSYLDALARSHCRLNLENRDFNLWDLILASDRVGSFLPVELRTEMEDWLSICTRLYSGAGEALGCADFELKARQVMVLIDGVHSWAEWDGSHSGKENTIQIAVSLARSMMAANGT